MTTEPTDEPVGEAVDPEQDMVAVLPGGSNVFCVHPGEVDNALERIGATADPDGGYVATLENLFGETETVHFEIVPTEQPYVCSNLWREQSERVSPIVDLVAFMPKAGNVLCVHPDHVEYALAEIGAEPIGDDQYFVYLVTEQGPEERLFRLKRTFAPILCAGGDDEKPPAAPNAGGSGGSGGQPSMSAGGAPGSVVAAGGAPGSVDAGGAAGSPNAAGAAGVIDDPCKEPLYPEMQPFNRCGEDEPWQTKVFESGIYTVYDRASCSLDVPANVPRCDSSIEYGWVKSTTDAFKSCFIGDGYCVGVKTLIGATRFYRDAECKGPVAEERLLYQDACTTPATDEPPGPIGGEVAAANDRFRLYRNAQCGPWKPAETHDCVDSANRALGRYSKEEYHDHPACRKGSGYCVETELEVGLRTYYDLRDSGNGECRMPVKVEKILAAACRL